MPYDSLVRPKRQRETLWDVLVTNPVCTSCLRVIVLLTPCCASLEKLANTERHLDIAKGHSQRAEDKTDELKQLNRSIFRPVITFNKDAKRAAQDAKVQQRYDEERDEREKAMSDIRETHDRLGQASNYGRRGGNDEGGVAGRYRSEAQSSARKEQRKRFQFDATASDDDMEDEIDGNLDEISDMTKRLKALGSAMGEELDRQNDRIGRITEKTDGLDNRIFRNTKRVSPTTTTIWNSCISNIPFHSSRRSSRAFSNEFNTTVNPKSGFISLFPNHFSWMDVSSPH